MASKAQSAVEQPVTLWRAVGQEELDLIAASEWRAWPPGQLRTAVPDRQSAVRNCRERLVPAEGVGYVVQFDVARSLLDRYDGPEFRIPADDLNAHLVGAISEEADYRGPVGDHEFAQAEQALGRPLPSAWRVAAPLPRSRATSMAVVPSRRRPSSRWRKEL